MRPRPRSLSPGSTVAQHAAACRRHSSPCDVLRLVAPDFQAGTVPITQMPAWKSGAAYERPPVGRSLNIIRLFSAALSRIDALHAQICAVAIGAALRSVLYFATNNAVLRVHFSAHDSAERCWSGRTGLTANQFHPKRVTGVRIPASPPFHFSQ